MEKLIASLNFDATTKINIQNWLSESYDTEAINQIYDFLENNPDELIDLFYKNLEFGTGGLRALMDIGTNRINVFTIKTATQGFANYILKQSVPNKKVVIGYDTRNHSDLFAHEAAKVLAGNGIQALVFKRPIPTPLVSFSCRYMNCIGAIMITASHNPPEYNGFKVYWKDGAQVLYPNDVAIINEINAIKQFKDIKSIETLDNSLITMVDKEIEQAYLEVLYTQQFYPHENSSRGNELKIVYTSLHGTGINIIPQSLKSWGFDRYSLVQEQCIPDGDFPTVKSPNPEDYQALELGLKQLLDEDADLFIATDPDADRLGAAINCEGHAFVLSGNQIACLCVEHICKALSMNEQLSSCSAFIKTVVTTELFKKIVESYGATCFETLTGFKYIAQLIDKLEKADNLEYKYIFGAEESLGYLLGSFVRDKDSISSSLLISEMALRAKLNNQTLLDQLYEIYNKHGFYYDKVQNILFEDTKEGYLKMDNFMQNLRNNPPKEVRSKKVVTYRDYLDGNIANSLNETETLTHLPKSDLLDFRLENGTKLMVRPSGTEPKIKIYCEVNINSSNRSLNELKSICETESQELIHTIETCDW